MNVLIVEDSCAVRMLSESYVRKEFPAANIESADSKASAETILKRWDEDHFDLVLLDLMLPDGSGHEVWEKISDHSPKAQLVIFSGGSAESANKLIGEQKGATFLPKSLGIRALPLFIQAAQ